jgi:hypothetical protein
MVDRETCGKAVESLSPRDGRQTELDGARLSQFGRGAPDASWASTSTAPLSTRIQLWELALPSGSNRLTPASACVTEPAGKSFKPAGAGG